MIFISLAIHINFGCKTEIDCLTHLRAHELRGFPIKDENTIYQTNTKLTIFIKYSEF